MRTRKKLLLGIVFAIAAAAVVWLALDRRPALSPILSFSFLSYTNVNAMKPVGLPQGDWIGAEVKLKNEGPVSITYGAWGLANLQQFGWVNARTATGWTPGN